MNFNANPACAYLATPPQFKILTSRAKFLAFVGGIGSGKTRTSAECLFRRARPNKTYFWGARKVSEIKDVILPTIIKQVKCAPGRWENISRSDWRGEISTPCGGKAHLIIRAPGNGEHGADVWRGPNIDGGAILEEATYHYEYAFDVLLGRLRTTDPKHEPWLMINCTPKGKSNWVYKLLTESGINWDVSNATTASNIFLGTYDADIRARYRGSNLAAQELDGIWQDNQLQIIPQNDITEAMRGNEKILWKDQASQAMANAYCVWGGYDVGGYGDSASVAGLEEYQETYYLRYLEYGIDAKGFGYDAQRAAVERLMGVSALRRMAMDSGGTGHVLAKDMARWYGDRIVPVSFTEDFTRRLCDQLRLTFANKRIKLPLDRVIEQDLQLLEWDPEDPNKVVVNRGASSHADISMSIGLALIESKQHLLEAPLYRGPVSTGGYYQ